MAHAETCPICWGKGKIQEPGSTAVCDKACHGCNGSGWVSVQDAPVPLMPYAPPDYLTEFYPNRSLP